MSIFLLYLLDEINEKQKIFTTIQKWIIYAIFFGLFIATVIFGIYHADYECVIEIFKFY